MGGEFARSMRNGEGRLWSHTFGYDGCWRQNMRHGNGKQLWRESGDIYEGQWEADKMHGFGTLETSSIKYTGEFRAGDFEGEGTQVWLVEDAPDAKKKEEDANLPVVKVEGNTFKGQFNKSRPQG